MYLVFYIFIIHTRVRGKYYNYIWFTIGIFLLCMSITTIRFNIINSIHNFISLQSQNQFYFYLYSFLFSCLVIIFRKLTFLMKNSKITFNYFFILFFLMYLVIYLNNIQNVLYISLYNISSKYLYVYLTIYIVLYLGLHLSFSLFSTNIIIFYTSSIIFLNIIFMDFFFLSIMFLFFFNFFFLKIFFFFKY